MNDFYSLRQNPSIAVYWRAGEWLLNFHGNVYRCADKEEGMRRGAQAYLALDYSQLQRRGRDGDG